MVQTKVNMPQVFATLLSTLLAATAVLFFYIFRLDVMQVAFGCGLLLAFVGGSAKVASP